MARYLSRRLLGSATKGIIDFTRVTEASTFHINPQHKDEAV